MCNQVMIEKMGLSAVMYLCTFGHDSGGFNQYYNNMMIFIILVKMSYSLINIELQHRHFNEKMFDKHLN